MSSTTVINPADESVIAEVPHTPLEAVDEAVSRAVVAQKSWDRKSRSAWPRRRSSAVVALRLS